MSNRAIGQGPENSPWVSGRKKDVPEQEGLTNDEQSVDETAQNVLKNTEKDESKDDPRLSRTVIHVDLGETKNIEGKNPKSLLDICKLIINTSYKVLRNTPTMIRSVFSTESGQDYFTFSEPSDGQDPSKFISSVKDGNKITVLKMKFDALQELKNRKEFTIYDEGQELSFTNLANNFAALAPVNPLLMTIRRKAKPLADLSITEEDRTYQKDQKPIFEYKSKDHKTDFSLASGYPMLDKDSRAGDPIADYMMCQRFRQKKRFLRNEGEVIVFSGADGSGWGSGAANTARDISNKFTERAIEALKNGIQDSRQLTGLLITALGEGHKEVVDDEDTGGGLTTHLGFVGKVDRKGVFRGVMTSVGDQKLFILRTDGTVEDMTKGNRGNITKATDPGGQLGGKGNKDPDLRNLTVYFLEAQKGDVLLPMSDGIHDNLDPQYVGEANPEAAFEKLLDNPALLQEDDAEALAEIKRNMPDNWDQQEDAWKIDETPELAQLKAIYQVYKLKEIVKDKEEDETISAALVRYAYNLTQLNRNYDEKHPTAGFETAHDPAYPKSGKQDHFSCAAITI